MRDGGERVFAFVFGDNQQASAGAEHACDTGYKSAYLLGSPEIPYTKDMTGFFADAFAEICGGEVVGEDTFKIGQTEFGPAVTKIQNASPAPDVIFSPIFVPDSGAFLKQLRSAGVETPFITTDGNDSVAVRRLGRKRGRRDGLLDPRLQLAGRPDRGLHHRLHGVEGRSARVEHVRGDRPRQRLRARRGRARQPARRSLTRCSRRCSR